MKKLSLSIILFIFVFQGTKAQSIRKINDTTILVNNILMHKDSIGFIPIDSNDTLSQQILNNDFSFLIVDSLYYNFKVQKIYKFKNGYGHLLKTKINNRFVYALNITMNENVKSKHVKIKVGNTYKMKLSRYFSHPLTRSVEYPPIYDIMLGKNYIGLLSIGYPYVFISKNVSGSYYIDSTEVNNIETAISKKTNEITEITYNFIKSISFNEDSIHLLKTVDTTLLKESLRNYHELFGPNMIEGVLTSPPLNVPLLEWGNYKIDTNSFNSFFWFMLNKFYSLPIKNIENHNLNHKDLDIKILHYSNNIYTVRVIWKLPSKRKANTAFLAITKINNIYKVIGFNKVW